ncbi:hypothetical protein QFZ79_000083 [Arthrobacter sp. V4I6]|nr:hypothetical protein [Arthrobacter sp. V1I7]MDQ0851972.1 hypothetical protein [Arthrobacter sp. V4I6]
MNVRPYAPMKIEQLEELAKSASGDSEVHRRLVAELQHRKNPRAQRLKSRLEGTIPPQSAGRSARSESSGKPNAVPPVSAVSCQEPSIAATLPTPHVSAEEHESLLRAFESLRATFTVEAELLARWGMTPALPQEIQDLVFQEWTKRLTSADNETKPVEAIAKDRVRIARERDALRGAMKAHGIIPPPPAVKVAPLIGDNQ